VHIRVGYAYLRQVLYNLAILLIFTLSAFSSAEELRPLTLLWFDGRYYP